MQGETLAALGDSLRREFQDMLNLPLPSLAELTGDDLIDALDGQLQGLAAWLTSTALSVALPPEVSDAPAEANERTAAAWTRPTSGVGELGGGTAAQIRPPEFANRRPPFEDAQRPSAAARLTTAPLPLSAAQTPPKPNTEQLRAVRQHPAADANQPQPQRRPQSAAPSSSTDVLPMGVVQGGAPAASEGQIALLQNSERQPFATPPQSEARTRQSFEPEIPAAAKSSPQPARGAGGFTVTRNLHDLARLLTSSEGHALDELSAVRTAPESDEAASLPVFGDQQRDSAAFVAAPAQQPTAPEYLDDPPSGVRVYEVQTPAAQPNITESHAPEPPELDMDSLLDALARSVAEDYRRFYGS